MSRMQAAVQRRQRGGSNIQPVPFAAPIGGWVTAQNLAASSKGTCIHLENGYATTKSIRARGGNQLQATVGSNPVQSLMVYQGATTAALFASSAGNIYNVGSVVDPLVPPAPVVSGRTANYYAHTNFATTGGYFMYAVNGADPALLYNGATFTAITGVSTPAITGANTSLFSHVNGYRNRLYFVQRDSFYIHYLPVDSIGGAVGTLSLAGVFRKGGSILFTATWSSESGSNSLSDYLVVVSTQGEIAIFQGSYPGGTDWSIAGVAEGSRPLGINGWMKAGGDITILTERGWLAVSAIKVKDPAALAIDALSSAIEPNWTRESNLRRGVPWEVAKWERKGLAYINVPVVSSATPTVNFVKNLQTGAWSFYSGWDMRTVIIFNEQLYFGTNDGTIRLAEVGGLDYPDTLYSFRMALSWDHMGNFGNLKTVRQVRGEFLTAYPFDVTFADFTGYVVSFPTAPNVSPDTMPSSLFDVGLWDVAVWDGGTVQYPKSTFWRSIGTTGEVHSLGMQITFGSSNTPDIELLSLVATVEQGGLVV